MSSCCADPADRVQLGPVWPGEFSVCVEDFTPAGCLHWGNVNSLCGSLGTVFHLPSRNYSNEARHIAFHPSLPAIRHSSQFSLWPQRSVYTQTQCSPLPSAKQLLCTCHISYFGILYFSGFGVLISNNTLDVMFLGASHSSK